MAFYHVPSLRQAVQWRSDQPNTVVRFTANGGLVLLHATRSRALTATAWRDGPLELALSGTTFRTSSLSMEVPPMLSLRLGGGEPLIAPICIFEIGRPVGIAGWLNARPMPAELRLVLLRLDPERPGQATVEANRRIWSAEWATADRLLRLRLEQQCLDTADKDAGQVQYNGRVLAVPIMAGIHLRQAEFRLRVAGPGPGTTLIQPN